MKRYVFSAVLLLLGTPIVAESIGGRQQYILLFKQPNASAPAAIMTDVELAGGHVDARGDDRLMISLPDPAVAAMRAHAGVKYLQRAVVGPQPIVTPVDPQTAPGRLTPETQRLRLQPAPMWDSSTYSYDGAGNITSIGTSTFQYDSLSRLKSAQFPGHPEEYTYDNFGNMTQRTTDNTPFSSPTDASNHLIGLTYDTAGNLKQNGTEQLLYDPFSNMREKDANGIAEIYVYDANDERIGVRTGPDHWVWSLRDENGQVLRQYESFQSNPGLGWTWVEDYVYRDGQLLGAEREPEEGGRRHFHLDHLGTPRLITSWNGQIVSSHDYFPFGGEITRSDQELNSGFSREDPMKFTGHERDFTSGTPYANVNYYDYMHARHGSPGWGKFLSPDPMLGNQTEPQSWNRYAYVMNNPMNRFDPYGLEDCQAGQEVPPGGCHSDVPGEGPNFADRPSFFWDRWMDHSIFRPTLTAIRTRYAQWKAWDDAAIKHFDECIHSTASWDVDCSDALTLRTGTVVIGGLGGFGAAEDVVVRFSEQAGVAHGVHHLVETGITEAEARAAIVQSVRNSVAGAASAPGASFWGRVVINGRAILFKAFVMADRSVNIGTFWPF